MRDSDEIGEEANGLIKKFSSNRKLDDSFNNKKREIDVDKNHDDDLFGNNNGKKKIGKLIKKLSVKKGKFHLSNLNKFAKEILRGSSLDSNSLDVNQNMCWEIIYDLIWRESGNNIPIDENILDDNDDI